MKSEREYDGAQARRTCAKQAGRRYSMSLGRRGPLYYEYVLDRHYYTEAHAPAKARRTATTAAPVLENPADAGAAAPRERVAVSAMCFHGRRVEVKHAPSPHLLNTSTSMEP